VGEEGIICTLSPSGGGGSWLTLEDMAEGGKKKQKQKK
jgi:hypothetical protein